MPDYKDIMINDQLVIDFLQVNYYLLIITSPSLNI